MAARLLGGILIGAIGCSDVIPPADAPVEPGPRCDCPPDEFCSERVCMPYPPPGSDIAVTIESGTFPATRSDGASWDLNSPPDPYVVVSFTSTFLGTTTVIGTSRVDTDHENPTWDYPLPSPFSVDDLPHIHLDVYDEDGATDDLMLSCAVSFGGPGSAHTALCFDRPDRADGYVVLKLTSPAT